MSINDTNTPSVNLSSTVSDPMTELSFLSKYTHIDAFQAKAFDIINKYNPTDPESMENILVTAHTGSGKSLVAEYGIYHTIKERGLGVIFTSPIKSLSNQKLYDFKSKFTQYGISIGILTGDIKFAPNADCVIMTTEILLNELLKYQSTKTKAAKPTEAKSSSGLTDLQIDFDKIGCIVFDEVHYINDADRGNVWEQSIMNIPKHVQLIMLSATLSSADRFAEWITNVQSKPTQLISTSVRVVPLYFSIYYALPQSVVSKLKPEEKKLIKINDLTQIFDTNQKRFSDTDYQKILSFDQKLHKKLERKFYPNTIINEMLNNFRTTVDNEDDCMFPILFFVLNKRKCIELAKSIGTGFNSGTEQIQVRDFIQSKVRELNASYLESIEQYHMVVALANKGIGVHHSGLLPILKEIVEMLYDMKLIKVLFATETFAVGLNMPTKTVVFTDMSKYSNNGYRLLHSHEFIQMAGRAGRRNIDVKGHVILLPQLFKNQLTNPEIVGILNGTGQRIDSKLHIDELLILRLLNSLNATDPISAIDLNMLADYVKTSMLAETNANQIQLQLKIVELLSESVVNISPDHMAKITKLSKADAFTNTDGFGFAIKINKKEEAELKALRSDKDLMTSYKIKSDYDKEKRMLDNLVNSINISIRNILNILSDNRMINIDDQIYLTNRGIIGASIMDTNPIIITDIITHPKFAELEPESIIGLLSTLTFDDKSTNTEFESFKLSNISNPAYKWIDIIESSAKSRFAEQFNFDYVWLIDHFVRTSEYISKHSDDDYLFEGNFVRSCSRLSNLLNEIRNIFQSTSNHDLVSKIDICSLLLQKEWLKPDSIYLRMGQI